MSNDGTDTGAAQTGGTDTPGTTETQPGKDTGTVYTQAQADDIAAKARATAERKAAKAQQELDDLRKQSMTDQEKAIQAARDEESSKWKAELEKRDRNSALTAQLAAAGVSPDAIPDLIGAAGAEWDDPAEAMTRLKAKFGPMFGKQTTTVPDIGGTQGADPTISPRQWTNEEIDEAVDNGTYFKHKNEIMAARATGTVRTADPGTHNMRPVN